LIVPREQTVPPELAATTPTLTVMIPSDTVLASACATPLSVIDPGLKWACQTNCVHRLFTTASDPQTTC
jgi:hypothetical protein